VDPFGHQGGALWQVVGYGVSALRLVAFVYWLVALIEHTVRRVDAVPTALSRQRYLIESYTLNSGMYIEITMNPTMAPTTTSMTGSRIDVRALTAAATWSS
jgi:hypothetical protein